MLDSNFILRVRQTSFYLMLGCIEIFYMEKLVSFGNKMFPRGNVAIFSAVQLTCKYFGGTREELQHKLGLLVNSVHRQF